MKEIQKVDGKTQDFNGVVVDNSTTLPSGNVAQMSLKLIELIQKIFSDFEKNEENLRAHINALDQYLDAASTIYIGQINQEISVIQQELDLLKKRQKKLEDKLDDKEVYDLCKTEYDEISVKMKALRFETMNVIGRLYQERDRLHESRRREVEEKRNRKNELIACGVGAGLGVIAGGVGYDIYQRHKREKSLQNKHTNEEEEIR